MNRRAADPSAALAGGRFHRRPRGLPPLLRESVDAMIAAWEKLDRGEVYLHWDCDFCNLQADINCAEVDQVISSEQAQYLREKYLRIEKEEF